jgi:hypothetical protein
MMPMINRKIRRKSLGHERLPSFDAGVDICNVLNCFVDLYQQEVGKQKAVLITLASCRRLIVYD